MHFVAVGALLGKFRCASAGAGCFLDQDMLFVQLVLGFEQGANRFKTLVPL